MKRHKGVIAEKYRVKLTYIVLGTVFVCFSCFVCSHYYLRGLKIVANITSCDIEHKVTHNNGFINLQYCIENILLKSLNYQI